MNIKRNIIFTLESRKKDGVLITENVPIRMRVNFASKRIEFTTCYRIDSPKWDADKQRVKIGCSNKLKQSASEINTSLLGYYAGIQSIFKRFDKPKLKSTQRKIIFLTLNELNRLREFKITSNKQALERVRDVFLFQCFTSLRYSDVFNSVGVILKATILKLQRSILPMV